MWTNVIIEDVIQATWIQFMQLPFSAAICRESLGFFPATAMISHAKMLYKCWHFSGQNKYKYMFNYKKTIKLAHNSVARMAVYRGEEASWMPHSPSSLSTHVNINYTSALHSANDYALQLIKKVLVQIVLNNGDVLWLTFGEKVWAHQPFGPLRLRARVLEMQIETKANKWEICIMQKSVCLLTARNAGIHIRSHCKRVAIHWWCAKGDIYLQLVRTRETNFVLNIAVVLFFRQIFKWKLSLVFGDRCILLNSWRKFYLITLIK